MSSNSQHTRVLSTQRRRAAAFVVMSLNFCVVSFIFAGGLPTDRGVPLESKPGIRAELHTVPAIRAALPPVNWTFQEPTSGVEEESCGEDEESEIPHSVLDDLTACLDRAKARILRASEMRNAASQWLQIDTTHLRC
jgi:hypothetical protein